MAAPWSEGMTTTRTVTKRHVEKMRQAVVALHDEVAPFLDDSGTDPAAGSIAAKEQADASRTAQLTNAYIQGHFLLESAADHVSALTRLLVEPVETLAPWTCLRGSLEAAALSCWLLSRDIDSEERIARSFALRYEGLSQQLKLANARQETALAIEISDGIKRIESVALVHGYKALVNKNGEHYGLAKRMPSITECIESILDREGEYRILSAVAHGHVWALTQLGFRTPDPSVPTSLEKSMSNESAAWLLACAADTLAKPVWTHASLFGSDLRRLSDILESTYTQMELAKKRHFWNPT